MLQDRITAEISQADLPKQLQLLANPPKQLFVQRANASKAFPRGNYIAMVGTRRPSASAKDLCRRLVKSLAGTDAIIVSGLAQGIDCYCHEAALDFGLKTIAVLAQGINARITGSRGVLANRIVESGGCLVTEYEGNTASHKGMFPARNRIIAALAETTVVVESGAKGGSLITAEFAQKLGRNIFAVPGDFDKETAQGTLELLRRGIAKPVFLPEDLCGLCGLLPTQTKEQGKVSKLAGLSANAVRVYEKFAGFTKSLSELNDTEGITANILFAILTELELAGLAHSSDGYRYSFERG